MKYLAVMTIFAALNVSAQEANIALEDDFKVAPELEKSQSSDYEEKKLRDGKVFSKDSDKEYKVTKGKESSDKLEIYQLKIEKKNGKIEKLEQIVEMDKNEAGKVKSIFKCGGAMKGGCQSFTPVFCKKLIEEDKIDEKISKDGEAKTIEFYKELYKEKEAFEPKSEHLAKLRDMNDKAVKDATKKPSSKELKNKIKPIYPSPLVLFKKDKIKGDIIECKKLVQVWVKPKEGSSSEENATAQSSAQ